MWMCDQYWPRLTKLFGSMLSMIELNERKRWSKNDEHEMSRVSWFSSGSSSMSNVEIWFSRRMPVISISLVGLYFTYLQIKINWKFISWNILNKAKKHKTKNHLNSLYTRLFHRKEINNFEIFLIVPDHNSIIDGIKDQWLSGMETNRCDWITIVQSRLDFCLWKKHQIIFFCISDSSSRTNELLNPEGNSITVP